MTEPPGAGPWAANSLLARLPAAERDALLALGTRVQYPTEKRVLITEDDDSTFVLVLLEGVVKVTRSTENGSEAFLTVRVEGELVGEFAALDQQPRSATVTTAGPVIARVIRGPDFLDLLGRRPALDQAVMRSVLGKMRAATSRRVDFTSYDGATRLARIVLELAERHGIRTARGVRIGFSLTQPELASLASISEPHVQRILRDLRTEGIILTGYGQLVVTDLAKLAVKAARPPAGQSGV